MNIIDFVNERTVFATTNIKKVQGKKISKLCSNNSYYKSVTLHDPEKTLFNLPNDLLTEQEIFV